MIYIVLYTVSEYMSLSKPSTSGGGHSSGYTCSICKIAFNVDNFFKKCMSEDKRSRLDFSKCQGLTAKACCVSKSTVLYICREAKKWGGARGTKRVFLSPTKHIQIPKV
jgi:hypothetical protein